MKKRIISIITVIIMSIACLGSLAACNDKKDTRTELVIMGWGFGPEAMNKLSRRMIAEFEKANPTYRVTVRDVAVDYEPTLMTLASNNKMPDVFMIPNLPTALQNEWCLDLTAMATADEDWSNIPAPVEKASRFNGKVFAVPAEMHLNGFFINADVFNDANKDPLAFNPTYPKFSETLSAFNKPADGIAAVNSESSLMEWYAAAHNANMGWYTWNDTEKKYDIDSAEFKAAMSEMRRISTARLSYESWTKADKDGTGETDAMNMFRKKKMAMYYGSTYEREGILKGEGSEVIFQGELQYIGTPGGRNAIIPDIWGVSASTKHAEMAYKLAKYLSFDPAGILKRLEIDTKNEFVSLPMSMDDAVIDAYFEKETVKGLKEVFLTIDKGIVESVKIIPGYKDSRWDAPTGLNYTASITNAEGEPATIERSNAKIGEFFDDIRLNQTVLDYAGASSGLNTLINNRYKNSVAALNIKYPAA